jgi:phage terminase small subunit
MAGTRHSGRRAVAPKVHVLRGTYQPSRHAGHDTPEPPPGTPDPPGALSTIARAEWDRMVTRLERSRTLSIVDDAALYQYAKLYAETEQIEADQAAQRRLLATLRADLKRTKNLGDRLTLTERMVTLQTLIVKATGALRQGHMAIRQYLVEFGMTPSARTRVKLPPAPPAVDPNKARYFGTGA